MVYHIFHYRVGGIWYRDSVIYSDTEFDAVMNLLNWQLPINMRVFHFGVPGPDFYPLNNPVVLNRPILSLDPMAMALSAPPCKAVLNDRQRQTHIPVLHQLGRFTISGCQEDWPRFCYVDGAEYKLTVDLRVIPLSFREAKEYVHRYHRHNDAPQGHKFSVGLKVPGERSYIGVAIASIPKARMLNDGLTLEINRVCCDSAYSNACSMLYGTVIRAGKSMGYTRFITYTLPEESGSSVKAAGFQASGVVPGKDGGWNRTKRPRSLPERYPEGQKLRWILDLRKNNGNRVDLAY